MIDLGYDRIGAIRGALTETAGMNMDVCDHDTPSFPTMGPELAEPPAVDDDDARPQRVWIDVVVEDELLDPPHLTVGAQQKGTALAPTAGTPTQFRDSRAPGAPATQDLRLRT